MPRWRCSRLIEHRQMFVSRQCADTHAGYAMSQIKKARGQNKWVNNPKPESAPTQGGVLPRGPWHPAGAQGDPPVRPVPLNVIGWRSRSFTRRSSSMRAIPIVSTVTARKREVSFAAACSCASRFRRKTRQRFTGLLLFNEQGWKQALVDHQNYWAWRRDRNPARWEQQERGELDFDAKNMMHTVRLLLSGRSILENGAPIVRFAGEPVATAHVDSRRRNVVRPDHVDGRRIGRGLRAAQDIESELPETCDVARASRLLTRAHRSPGRRRIA